MYIHPFKHIYIYMDIRKEDFYRDHKFTYLHRYVGKHIQRMWHRVSTSKFLSKARTCQHCRHSQDRSSKSIRARCSCQRARLDRFTCFTFLFIVFHQWKTFSDNSNRQKDEKKSQEPKGRKYDLANSLISRLLQQAELHCSFLSKAFHQWPLLGVRWSRHKRREER